MIRFYHPTPSRPMRDLAAFYAATWRDGAVMLAVFPAAWIAALILEVMYG